MSALIASGDGAEAGIRVEQPLGRERGAIAAAEAGRHLAILGACALAGINPLRERHYYLATDALLLACADATGVAEAAHLAGRATASFESKRRGRARCALASASGSQLYTLDVGYAVMSEHVFERLFAGAHQEHSGQPATNPHAQPLPLSGLVYHAQGASFVLSRLEAGMCAGHFDGYPLLPVAIVMRTLSDVAGALLQHITGDPELTYVVQRAEVEAHNFAKPSDALLFEAAYAGSDATDRHSFVCRASVPGGAAIGTLRLVLVPHASGGAESGSRTSHALTSEG